MIAGSNASKQAKLTTMNLELVCVDNGYIEDELTVGKVYTGLLDCGIPDDRLTDFITVNDKGVTDRYFIERFNPIKN